MPIFRSHVMHNGVVMEMEGDIVDMLRFGYAPLGWEGDPNLSLAYNRETDRIELWREEDDGVQRIVVRSKPGMRMVDMDLIRFLVTHDRNRGFDVEKDIDTHNNKILEANRIKTQEAMDEAAGKLQHALKKDFGIRY